MTNEQTEQDADFNGLITQNIDVMPEKPASLGHYIVSVRVAATDKQAAHALMGTIIRTDATMHNINDDAFYPGKLYVDWESLHAEEVPERAPLTPLGQRVLIERVETETQTEGGILLPEEAQEKQLKAIVRALGTGGRDECGQPIPFGVAVNDLVLTTKYGGTDVSIQGKNYTIINECDILAVLGQEGGVA